MKNVLIAILALGAAAAAFADAVTEEQVTAAVTGWVNAKAALGEEFTATPESVTAYDAKDGKGKFYVVHLAGGGFVVTSGDTALEPVLAYSKDGTWVDDVTKNPLLAMLPIDVAAAMDELSSANSANSGGGTSGGGVRRLSATAGGATSSATEKAAKWAEFIAGGSSSSSSRQRLKAGRTSSIADVRVKILLDTEWSQSDQENYYTPYQWYCGCVATAGAQIMYYYKWPTASVTAITDYAKENGVGSDGDWILSKGYRASSNESYTAWTSSSRPAFGGTYNWASMSSSTTYSTRRSAISKLTRDVGIASYMMYGSGGSAASTGNLRNALVNQFNYANAVCKYWPTADEWRLGMLASLDAQWPVSVEVPGHEIVADGYGYQSGTLYIHFNFGWGGSSNAWYAPPDLTEAGSKYNTFYCLIYNIYPEGEAGRTTVSGRILSGGSAVAGASVRAVDRDTGDVYTATASSGTSSEKTASGIYALSLPPGRYAVSSGDGSGNAFVTNVTVESCESSVKNIHGLELPLAAVSTPVISPASGTVFNGAKQSVSITAAASEAIRYTTDGSEPTTSSTLYTGPFTVSGTTTVKARAFAGGAWAGATATATYTKADYWGEVADDNRKNRAARWIDERSATQEATGTWSNEVAYVDGKAAIAGENAFEPSTQSPRNRKATVKMTVTARSAVDANAGGDYADAKAAVRIGSNGRFQVYTKSGGSRAWRDVTGVTPAKDVEYEITLALDFRAQTYTATVKASGGSETPLADGSSTSFAFANDGTQVTGVRVDGLGDLTAIEGSYKLPGGAMILAY